MTGPADEGDIILCKQGTCLAWRRNLRLKSSPTMDQGIAPQVKLGIRVQAQAHHEYVWLSLGIILRSWWIRIWTIQEVVLAQDDPVLICGSMIESFECFIQVMMASDDVPDVLIERPAEDQMAIITDSLRPIDETYHSYDPIHLQSHYATARAVLERLRGLRERKVFRRYGSSCGLQCSSPSFTKPEFQATRSMVYLDC